MIEASLSGPGLVARLTAAVERKLAQRSGRSRHATDPALRWRRADLLWPDLAPRYKD